MSAQPGAVIGFAPDGAGDSDGHGDGDGDGAGHAPRRLAQALDLPFEAVTCPTPSFDPDGPWRWSFAAEIEAAAAVVAAGPPLERAVVCTWAGDVDPVPVAELDPVRWMASVEVQLGLWYRVVVAAAARCADGGALVVVVERPAPVDVTGHGAATAAAEGLATLTRSMAFVHGTRGVRANTVTTELATAPDVLLGLAPPLPTFPGTVEGVAGAVRMLLEPGAAGVTGIVLPADSGRSW